MSRGFTLTELLVSVTIIAVLTVAGLFGFTSVVRKAQYARAKADMSQLMTAIDVARKNSKKNLTQIFLGGANCPECSCHNSGTPLKNVPKTDSCWQAYYQAIDEINNAAGYKILDNAMVDPWGSPYLLDANEGELHGECGPRPNGTPRSPTLCCSDNIISAGPDGETPSGNTWQDNIEVVDVPTAFCQPNFIWEGGNLNYP